MLTTIKNNKSLTYYQQTPMPKSSITSAYAGGISSVAIANTSMITVNTTMGFNTQLNGFLTSLGAEQNRLAQNVAQKLAENPLYTGARGDGVNLAWKYEAADIEMGGKGSANWNNGQREQILDKGKVRGAEGHHQKNVANHPEHQADPDNIKFYENRDDHLRQGHDGNFQNETDAPMIGKNKMLKKTNFKRVIKNELTGLGIAAAIGIGVGATIGFVVTLAQSGVTPETIKLAAIEGGKSGLESGALVAVGYGVGRTIGEIACNAITNTIKHAGFAITENISKMISMGVVGVLTITVFSAYQFIKLKMKGVATKEALMQVGKQALFSLSLLAVSIAAQGIWGGPAGIIVSVSAGIILISYTVGKSVHDRHFAERIRVYMIDKCYPSLAI